LKRKAIALLPILGFLISILSVMLHGKIVVANPFMPSGSWSDEPVPPSIKIESPSEILNYGYESYVWLIFTVTVPWTDWYNTHSGYLYPEPYATTLGNLTEVTFSLDGNAENNISKISESPIEVSKVYHPYGGVLRFAVNLRWLSVGRHTIVINAEGSAYYGNLTHGAFSDNFAYDSQEGGEIKLVQSSADISFVVCSDLIQEPSPTSTSTPQPTASPTATPTPTLTPEPTSEDEPISTTLVTASIGALAIVGTVMLVYFKKRNTKLKALVKKA
jgi:hypothetical protein